MDRLAGLKEETRKLALDQFHLLQRHLEENRPLRLVAASPIGRGAALIFWNHPESTHLVASFVRHQWLEQPASR
jgi:hypothetical protein